MKYTTIKFYMMAVLLILSAGGLSAQDATASVQSQTNKIQKIVSDTTVPAQADAEPMNDTDKGQKEKLKWSRDTVEKFNRAENGTSENQTTLARSKEGSGIRVLLAFVIMGALLFAMYYLLKKYGKRMTGQDSSKLKLLSRIYIDSKNSVILVKCYEDEFLIGINASSQPALLHKYKQIESGSEDEEDSPVPDETEKEMLDFKSVEELELKKIGEIGK